MLFGLFSGMSITGVLLLMLYRIPGLLIGFTVHEWAHAFAAYKLGDATAKNLGRLSLDPLKHIDFIGALMFIIFGFGWARPVVFNPRNFKKPRRDENIVSLAGCAANFLVAFLCTGLYFLLQITFGVQNEIILNIVYMSVIMNLVLALFNLIPIPPLDGYHVLKNAFIRVGRNFFYQYERYGQYILLAVIITGIAGRTVGFLIEVVFGWFLDFFNLIF